MFSHIHFCLKRLTSIISLKDTLLPGQVFFLIKDIARQLSRNGKPSAFLFLKSFLFLPDFECYSKAREGDFGTRLTVVLQHPGLTPLLAVMWKTTRFLPIWLSTLSIWSIFPSVFTSSLFCHFAYAHLHSLSLGQFSSVFREYFKHCSTLKGACVPNTFTLGSLPWLFMGPYS